MQATWVGISPRSWRARCCSASDGEGSREESAEDREESIVRRFGTSGARRKRCKNERSARGVRLPTGRTACRPAARAHRNSSWRRRPTYPTCVHSFVTICPKVPSPRRRGAYGPCRRQIRGRPFWNRSYRSVNGFATSNSCSRRSTVPSDRGKCFPHVLTDRYRRAAVSRRTGLRVEGEPGGNSVAESSRSAHPVVQAPYRRRISLKIKNAIKPRRRIMPICWATSRTRTDGRRRVTAS